MFKDKFIKLCNQIGESPSAVCQKIGLSTAAYSKWSENSVPRRTTLQKFADYFGITIEDLLSDEEPSPSINIGEFEKELLSVWNKLDIKGKNLLLTRAYELLKETNH